MTASSANFSMARALPSRLRAGLFSDRERGPLAPRRTHHARRQPVSHPRARTGSELYGHTARRPLRMHCLHELATAQFDEYRQAHLKPGDPRFEERYICGDMNTSLIKTVKGSPSRQAHRHHASPLRPHNMIAGPKASFRTIARIYFDEMNKMNPGDRSTIGSSTRTRSGRGKASRPRRWADTAAWIPHARPHAAMRARRASPGYRCV